MKNIHRITEWDWDLGGTARSMFFPDVDGYLVAGLRTLFFVEKKKKHTRNNPIVTYVQMAEEKFP